ncbi:uncharacterized protein G2W53_039684 [Senna tora]|uniref:Uncharacterized protein n=1 Tax=Senna tora TaxID=362788 RepID=A0A834SQY8_9FABA|nr:uncharacterized protein G2W53_039684 [Senna tora]
MATRKVSGWNEAQPQKQFRAGMKNNHKK